MEKDILQSKVIQWMRFPLTFCILLLHFNSGHVDGYIFYNYLTDYISLTWAPVCLPIFYFFSGYLFFLNVETFSFNIFWKKIKSRIRTLIVPYFLWNILSALIPFLILIAIVIKNHEPVSWLTDYIVNLRGWHMFWDYNQWGTHSTGPINLPLHYLRNLIVLSLSTPIIYFFIKRLKYVFLLLLVSLYIINSYYWLFINVRSLMYFGFGAYLALNKYNFLEYACRYIKLAVFLSVVLSVILTLYGNQLNQLYLESYFYEIFVISAFCVISYIASKIITKGKGGFFLYLAQSSFFVYCVHEVEVYRISKWIVDLCFPATNTIFIYAHYFLYPILATAICVSIYFIMKKFMPKLLGILTGGRINKFELYKQCSNI